MNLVVLCAKCGQVPLKDGKEGEICSSCSIKEKSPIEQKVGEGLAFSPQPVSTLTLL